MYELIACYTCITNLHISFDEEVHKLVQFFYQSIMGTYAGLNLFFFF